MGWAIPAAVGVQCARRDRRVAVITGDGCMQMHGMDVQTAARYRLPIVYVVLNNGALGNVWLRAHQYGPLPSELTTIPDHDWAGFARSLGAQGMTVTDTAALRETFAKAVATDATVVIDVKADEAARRRFTTSVPARGRGPITNRRTAWQVFPIRLRRSQAKAAQSMKTF